MFEYINYIINFVEHRVPDILTDIFRDGRLHQLDEVDVDKITGQLIKDDENLGDQSYHPDICQLKI